MDSGRTFQLINREASFSQAVRPIRWYARCLATTGPKCPDLRKTVACYAQRQFLVVWPVQFPAEFLQLQFSAKVSASWSLCKQNTLSHTHFSQSCRVAHAWAHVTFTRACVWLNMFTGVVLSLCALKNHLISQPCFTEHFSAYLTPFSSFCSSPPQTTPTSRPLTGIRSTSLCHFARRKAVWLSG